MVPVVDSGAVALIVIDAVPFAAPASNEAFNVAVHVSNAPA